MYNFLKSKSVFLLLPACTACIGIDETEDAISRIEIISGVEFLYVTESAQLEARGINQFGDAFAIDVHWSSSDSTVATVDESGEVVALAQGQTSIVATAGGLSAPAFVLNVIDISAEIAYILVSHTGTNLSPGGTTQLTASAFNPFDEELEVDRFEWFSSDEAVATVDENGRVTAVGVGFSDIRASVDEVESSPVRVEVAATGNLRMGMFSGKGGYSVSGDVTLSTLPDGSLQVQLQDNFMADNGPGLYVYLSNSSSGVSGGVELGALASNDMASVYSTSGVALQDYDYVIILCKPFNVVFGFALLN